MIKNFIPTINISSIIKKNQDKKKIYLTIKKIALKSEAEVMLLTEDSLKKIEPGLEWVTISAQVKHLIQHQMFDTADKLLMRV